VFLNGRVDSYRLMPWGAYTNWTDEDCHAAVVSLRHLKPIRHLIQDPVIGRSPMAAPGALEEVLAGKDYGR
jgi:hypothetical protein